MIIKYKTPGAKKKHAQYSAEGSWLTVADAININLAKYERDDDFHMDICSDAFGNLTTGVIPGYSEKYVAQIDIPARTYHTVEGEETAEDGSKVLVREADPYNPANTTLTLWEV